VYSRVKSRNETAARGVKREARAALRAAAEVLSRTESVLTTASLAVKPVISPVATRQSPKPAGRKTGAINCPIAASRLSALSLTRFRRVSKLCGNQDYNVARNSW
jgi:hypothetical protein